MFSRLRRHIGSAHVIALIALFVALVGSAYAAGLLPKNSVGAKQLKRGAVTPPKLSHSTVEALQGKTGERGERGATGDKGAPGPAGPSDVYAAGNAEGSVSGSFAQVAAITVPPGDYLLQAKTTILSAEGLAAIVSCQIAPTAANGIGTWDATRVGLPAIKNEISGGVAALAGADSFSSAQSIVLACITDSGTATFDDARVWAIKVSAVHGIPLPID